MRVDLKVKPGNPASGEGEPRAWLERTGIALPFGLLIPALLTALTSASAAAQAPASAQDPLLGGVNGRIDLTEEAPGGRIANVRLEYRLEMDPAVDDLRLYGLAFAGANPVEVRAAVDGVRAPVEMDAPSAGRLAGRVRLPVERADTLRLRLTYRVRHAGGGESYNMAVPLLLPQATPTGAPSDFFTATLDLPAHHAIVESFPVLPARTERAARATWDLQLQVVPAVVRWRAHTGAAPPLRFTRVVDLLALFVLLATGIVAVRLVVRQQGG